MLFLVYFSLIQWRPGLIHFATADYGPKQTRWNKTELRVFDDLANLALIEVLSYLSCTDALCAFNSLNDRWTRLLVERGFFRHVNLSATYSRQFDQLLQILPLNNIETLIIDRTASPLQLMKWPYLTRLTKLHLQGVREYNSILIFALLHAATLTRITIQSDGYSLTVGDWQYLVVITRHSFLCLLWKKGWVISKEFPGWVGVDLLLNSPSTSPAPTPMLSWMEI